MCGCLSCAPHWDLACNPGMCPDWESNQRPFGLKASAQSTEPHQPGLFINSLCVCVCVCTRLECQICVFGKIL